jgi:hypothetical protein
MNFWYSSRPNEIFLDLDSNRAIARALSVLRLAIRRKQLPIMGLFLYRTRTEGHAHMIVLLSCEMSWQKRLGWALWLGNDRLRAAYVLARHSINGTHAKHAHDLLVSTQLYYRPWDAFCECKKKHKKKAVTDKCPAMEHLLMDQKSADYFTRTGKKPPRKKIRVPWGEVSLDQLSEWKEVYE